MQSATYRPQSQRLQILEVFKKYPDFRRYYIGLVTSVFGYRMIVDLTLGWLIFDLTHDERYLGYMFVAMAVPTVVLNLLGGVLADKLDPRHLLGAAEGFSAIEGLMFSYEADAKIARIMSNKAAKTVVLATAQKIGRRDRMTAFPASRVDVLITDCQDESRIGAIRNLGVSVIVASKEQDHTSNVDILPV